MALRVIQWAPGHVGQSALLGILDHPDLELVGVRVYSPGKDGKDAGELCGRPPTGVVATRDADALLAMDADCVVYCGSEADYDSLVNEWCAILSSGKNLVSSAMLPMVFPPALPEWLQEKGARIEAACQQGGTSVYVSGINPGLLLDIVPAILASGCRDLESISVVEHYDDVRTSGFGPDIMKELFGFGVTPEEDAPHADARILVCQEYWASTLRLLAHDLGGELGPITTTRETVLATEFIDAPGVPIEPGTIAGLHVHLEGAVGGTRLAYHEYVCMGRNVPRPGWPKEPEGGGYRILIEGRPNLQVEMTLIGDGKDPLDEAFVYTAYRIVNAVPAVCAAPPGMQHFSSIAREVSGHARPAPG